MKVIGVFLLVMSLSFLATVPVSALDEQVSTTDRLNLRSCPGSDGCPVLRTLPINSVLQVTEHRGDWLRVIVLSDKDVGWVNSRYTTPTVPIVRQVTPSVKNSQIGGVPFRILMPVSFMVGLIAVGAICRKLIPIESISASGAVVTWTVGQVFGALFLLNQFGFLLEWKLSSFGGLLERLRPIWEVNMLVPVQVSFLHVFAFLAVIMLGVMVMAPSLHARKIYIIGTVVGFLAVPALVLAAAVLVALWYVLGWLWQLAQWLLSYIAIPFLWVWKHALLPLLQWVAVPFVWLWESFLEAIFKIVAIPFVWLWAKVLSPVLSLAWKYALAPAMLIAVAAIAWILILLPISAVGLVLLESLRSSVRGKLDAAGFFSLGASAGFLLFELGLTVGLCRYFDLQATPALALLVPVTFQALLLPRLVGLRGHGRFETESVSLRESVKTYLRTSRLEVAVAALLVPVGVAALLLGGNNE